MKILLCGFMGCGKTSIGKRTAKLLNYKFVDMDIYIENKENLTVKEIFAKKGESYFRDLETKICAELCQFDNIIIASGGGTVMKKENIEVLNKANCKIIFIEVPIKALQERLKRDTRRPLLQRNDRNEFIENLYNERYPVYKKVCDITFDGAAPTIYLAKKLASLINSLDNILC
ncbi:MAG: shikimate kinase [Clostridia bacterium]